MIEIKKAEFPDIKSNPLPEIKGTLKECEDQIISDIEKLNDTSSLQREVNELRLRNGVLEAKINRLECEITTLKGRICE